MNKSSLFLGLAIGVLIVTGAIIGFTNYYNPNQVSPTQGNYTVAPQGDGFLLSVTSEKQITGRITVEFVYSGTNSGQRTVDLPSTGDPVYLEPGGEISDVQAVVISYNGENILNQFVNKELDEQLSVDKIGNITVRPQQRLNISIDRFVNNSEMIESYTWDTGLDIIDNKTFSEIYEENGIYTGTLIVEDYQGRRYQTTFNIIVGAGTEQTRDIQLPYNNVSFGAESNEIISFSAKTRDDSLRSVESYSWNFDDGVKTEGKDVLHKYQEDGKYEIKMTARFTGGDSETHRFDVIVGDNDETGIIVSESEGYEFSLRVHNPTSNATYSWSLGDNTTRMGTNVTHTYEEYGSYEVTVEEQYKGSKEYYNLTVDTEVLVRMGADPYIVTYISGDHGEDLLPRNQIGDQNPSLSFQKGIRYRITSLPISTQFESRNGRVLLSQSGNGYLENDPEVDWREISDSTVEFTVTEELGNQIYSYGRAE